MPERSARDELAYFAKHFESWSDDPEATAEDCRDLLRWLGQIVDGLAARLDEIESKEVAGA